MFGLSAFVFIYYGKDTVAGLLAIATPILFSVLTFVLGKDLEKAYIEIIGDNILVVDYYFGTKKEKTFSFSDITSAEIVSGYHVRGPAMTFGAIYYIVFKNGKKYLFKVICLPETMQLFKQYIDV